MVRICHEVPLSYQYNRHQYTVQRIRKKNPLHNGGAILFSPLKSLKEFSK